MLASVPAGVTEAWSVDMGCVGDGLMCTEREVSSVQKTAADLIIMRRKPPGGACKGK